MNSRKHKRLLLSLQIFVFLAMAVLASVLFGLTHILRKAQEDRIQAALAGLPEYPEIRVEDLGATEHPTDVLTVPVRTLLFTYNEFRCLRCPIMVRKAIEHIKTDSFFRQNKVRILFKDVSPRTNNTHYLLSPQRNQVFFLLDAIPYPLNSCYPLLQLRPEIPVAVRTLTDCIRKETEVKIRRSPKVLSDWQQIQYIMKTEGYTFLHIGSDPWVRPSLTNLDRQLTHAWAYIDDWNLADQVSAKYQGGLLSRQDHFCILRADHLVDSFDPYQLKCTAITRQTPHYELEAFYINERHQKVMMGPPLDHVFEHLRLGKALVIYVCSQGFQSEKYRQFLKILMGEENHATAFIVYNSTDIRLSEMRSALNLTDYRFPSENVFMVFHGEAEGYTAVRMRGELNRWDLKRFIERKLRDKDYDELERMTQENQEEGVGRPQWTHVAVLTLVFLLWW
jgi:hypothetical protein